MGNKSQVGLAIHTQKQFYLPGDVVQGSIFINSPKPYPCSKIMLYIEGKQKSWFRDLSHNINASNPQSISSNASLKAVQPNQRKNQAIKKIANGQQVGQNKILEASFVLMKWDNSAHLHGQYAFPFVFQLPSYIPGSFHEENALYRASIKYQIKCVGISHNSKHQHMESAIELIIRQPQRNKQESMYGQIFVYPQTCFCRKHGVSRICCYFEKNQYMPGQQCIAICEADNYKCKIRLRQIKVQFFKEIILTSNFGQQKQFMKQIRSVSFPGVGPHGMYKSQNAQRLSLPLKYREQNIQMHPSTQGRLVKCNYFLQVTPIFLGACLENTNYFRLNLNILQKPPPQSKIEEPNDWNPEVFRKSEIFLGQEGLENEQLAKMNEYN